ncbi:MAG: hypothetical protein PHQ14_06210 [Chromatiales bacterium]|jgi:hypothetical protein|nr:hypothetical protein [Chromatiales bacterium]MDX9767475.1 hypothetical protein [Ectothiorhodospiraceae bacterium]
MTKYEAVGLALRVAAIFLFVNVLQELAVSFQTFGQTSGSLTWIIIVAGATSLILVALLLWMFPMAVTRRLLPTDKAQDSVGPWRLEDVQVVAFSVLGVYILVRALPWVVYWISLRYQIRTSDQPEFAFGAQERENARLLMAVFEVGLGFWLLFGARGLVGMLRWFRSLGSD